MDWRTWHDKYDSPNSPLARRLRTVQARVRVALDDAPAGPLRVISLCAGQGRDLLEVLSDHPRRADVRARLVELDAGNIAHAAATVRATGFRTVEVVTGDASLSDHYRNLVPADLVLMCGVFGNLSDADIERLIGFCPQLCRTGGTVIWTRHPRAPNRVPLICDWFKARRFEQLWLSDDEDFGVGAHRFIGESQLLAAGVHMFNFVGYDKLGA